MRSGASCTVPPSGGGHSIVPPGRVKRHRRKRRPHAGFPQPIERSADAGLDLGGHHLAMSAKQELHHLEQVAKDGVSDETPLILLGFNILLWAAIVLLLVAVGLLAYRLAT